MNLNSDPVNTPEVLARLAAVRLTSRAGGWRQTSGIVAGCLYACLCTTGFGGGSRA